MVGGDILNAVDLRDFVVACVLGGSFRMLQIREDGLRRWVRSLLDERCLGYVGHHRWKGV
jgi:hypothetical protein